MNQRYLLPVVGGCWAISRTVAGKRIALIERGRLYDESDAELVLRALGIECTIEHLDEYFPHHSHRGRCPTLALLELFATLGNGTGSEVGV